MFLTVKKLSADARLPVRAYPTDAGADLCSAIACTVPPRSSAVIPTGLSVKLPTETCGPKTTYGRIAPCSDLLKHGIDVGATVIDAGYRGEISVVLFNHSDDAFDISKGDAIAQLVVERIVVPEIVEVHVLALAER